MASPYLDPSSPRAAHLLAEGDGIARKYRSERVFGVGGLVAVVAATNLALGSRVALKLMLAELADSPSLRRASFAKHARRRRSTASTSSACLT